MADWYQREVSDVLKSLDARADTGLDSNTAAQRLEESGLNELVQTGQRGPWSILWEQISGAMMVLLYAAAAVSIYLDEPTDAIAILAIVVLNAILGFVQDYRAEKALAALKQLAVPTVRVRRNGSIAELSSRELVPGDIVLLEAGSAVPADCRVVESINMAAQESALTGESNSIDKFPGMLSDNDLPLGDRTNMLWMGTTVTYGHGVAVVVQTGMQTQLGHIATSLQTVEAEPTPLQRRLARMGRSLAIVALGIVAVVFAFGLLRGEEPRLMLMTALSLAVAVVPEGLPAVATVALALGARRMFRRHALIRKLPAVETLGSVTVICSDKTGTLTENRMTVSALDVAGQRLAVNWQHGEASASSIADSGSVTDVNQTRSTALLLTVAGLCNDSILETNADSNESHVTGEPTEAALMLAADRLGLRIEELHQTLPRVAEIPFDSDRKRMTTVHELQSLQSDVDASGSAGRLAEWLELEADDCIALTKGAVDSVLNVCEFVWSNNEPVPLDDEWTQRIESANDELATQGMRVLSIALRPAEKPANDDLDTIEKGLIFIGLVAMIDPPRAEVKDAVARCREAGIRPVMITGDHPLTALHIAKQLGIADNDSVLTGRELAGMSVDDLEPVVEEAAVYARVAPQDKLHIVQALQNRDHVVAMTGDGVNDAPALKQAHIGVAMGQVGTDVSKEASEMVLLDDNFATIVNAVEQGRIVYDNIRKFVKYTMTSNAGEVCVMILGPLVGMPLPLLPLQILWVNLVTDGLPGLALAVEPAERNTMRRPPVQPHEHILGRGMAWDIAWIGILMGVVSLGLGYWYWAHEDVSDNKWRTIVFTVLTLSQMGNALATRSETESLFRQGVFSNRALIGSILLTFVLQLGVVYLVPLQTLFRTEALSLLELGGCLLLSTVVFLAVELKKWLVQSRADDREQK